MASCSPPSRWRWRRRRANRASGARRSPARAAARTRCRFRTGASLSSNANAARNVALEVHAHLRALSVTERIEAVVAVPADLDAGALTVLRGALQRRGRGYARLPRFRHAHRRGRGRSQPLRAARCRLAFRHRDARGRRRRMHLRRSLRERARQSARRLRSVAHRRGRRAGQKHALRSAAQPRRGTAPVRRPAACSPRVPPPKARWKPWSNPKARASRSPSMRSSSPMRHSRSIASSRA